MNIGLLIIEEKRAIKKSKSCLKILHENKVKMEKLAIIKEPNVSKNKKSPISDIQQLEPLNNRQNYAQLQDIDPIFLDKLESKLASKKGLFVAIDIESYKYATGNTLIEAVLKAQSKFPQKRLHCIKIGYSYIYKHSGGIKQIP